MTFIDREQSVESSQPIELYHFWNAAEDWYYTSFNKDVTHEQNQYESKTISRSEPSMSSKVNESELTLTVARDLDLISRYRIVPPESNVFVRIFRYHEGDKQNISVIWQGRVQAVAWETKDRAKIKLKPMSGMMDDNGLRKQYQMTCNHMLYGDDCGLNSENYRTDATIDGISGRTYTISEASNEPDGYFDNGFAVVGGFAQKMITEHVGDQITLMNPFQDVAVGDQVKLYAGCNRKMNDCRNKFDNLLNFGGFAFIPDRNPFDQGIF